MAAGVGKSLKERVFHAMCLVATYGCVVILLALVASIFWEASGWLDWQFLTSRPSHDPEKAGVLVPLIGSLWIIGITTLVAVPMGIGAAVYLEEYLSDSLWKSIVQINISNLAGVPSIVYGLLGLVLFVRLMHFGRSILAASLTLALVILPIIIIATQEALRAVPPSIRHASFALGATRWQTVRHQVLPAAMPGIMTGVILSMARALGEAAPLIIVGGVGTMSYTPTSVYHKFMALPTAIYNWSSRPQAEFANVAAAGIVVLLVFLVILNAAAVTIRYRFGKRTQW
ncbi:MAG: phosphate ABC transporter permease PstA [Pirellulaceae bacterium]|nr:phosphate ABC transporter permease PstA [Planctomycetales bacterium]